MGGPGGLSRLTRKLRWSIAHRGLLGTVRFALGRVGAAGGGGMRVHPFDVEHGVETSGLIGGADLATGHMHDVYNTAYYGMSPSRFRGAMELWAPEAPRAEYSFVDLGCGKGRALLLATEGGFREVVGVELHPGLAAVAEANLRVWEASGKGGVAARVVCGEATEFVFPEGPCLLYLFNPFAAPVMERLLARIAVQFRDRAGLLDVIYFNPEAAGVFEARPGFERMWAGTVAMSEEDAAADLVAGPEDVLHLYRWVGTTKGL